MPRLAKTVLAVALFSAVLAAPAAARWEAPASPTQTAKAASTPKLLKQAKQALAPGGPRVDLSPILKELAARLPNLRGSERTQARTLLLRPTDGEADPQGDGYSVAQAPPLCSAHFCIHYVATTVDAPPMTDNSPANGIPDYVERARDAAEESYTVENGQLGWRTPKSDGTQGGDGRTDVYIKQLGNSGIYGYAAPDPQPRGDDNSVYAYLVIDDDYAASEFSGYDSPITPLRVTVAHEYDHILQYTYDFLQDTWMLESTAVWMEGKVVPEARDYLQYLDTWVQLTGLPLTSFNGADPNDRDNLKVYGTALWNKWLEGRYDASLIRRAWEVSLITPRPSFAVEAYDRAIRDKGGAGFADEFDRFAAASAEWGAQNSGFPEGNLYPDVVRAGTATVNGPGGQIELDHTGYALVGVNGLSAPRVKLSVRAPAGTRAALALVGRFGAGGAIQQVVDLKQLPGGGSGTVVVEDPSRFSRLTAVLVNSDSRVIGSSQLTGDWVYGRDSQLFYARMSTDFTGPRVTKRSPAAGARGVRRRPTVKVTFSERVLGVGSTSLRLLKRNGQAVPARVRFTRGARTATLTPKGRLASRGTYTVRVNRKVTDTALNPLRSTTSWSFVTAR